MDDASIQNQIEKLVAEEHELMTRAQTRRGTSGCGRSESSSIAAGTCFVSDGPKKSSAGSRPGPGARRGHGGALPAVTRSGRRAVTQDRRSDAPAAGFGV